MGAKQLPHHTARKSFELLPALECKPKLLRHLLANFPERSDSDRLLAVRIARQIQCKLTAAAPGIPGSIPNL